jgi:hypothetical protein
MAAAGPEDLLAVTAPAVPETAETAIATSVEEAQVVVTIVRRKTVHH